LPDFDFRVLGPLEVLRDGEPVPLSPKQRTLLALLALRANAPVAQRELIDMLWQADAPPTARAVVQNLVHALRQRLDRETVERTSAGYRLCVHRDSLDVERFRRLLRDASHAPAVSRAPKLREAVALWRGRAFTELVETPQARPALRRLEDERLTALEDLIDADLELGQYVGAIPRLEELVELHPLRERLWAQLMLALYRAGRQAEALASYQRARGRFVDELGVEPGLILRELQRAILVQDPALDDSKDALGTTLERAAAIIPREPRARAESLVEFGRALIRLGELRQASLTLEGAERLAETAHDRGIQERARLWRSHLTVFAHHGSFLDHLAVTESAARVFEELGDDAGAALSLSHQAHMLRDTGRADVGLELALRGVELATGAGDMACAAACRRIAAVCAAMGSSPVGNALALCERPGVDDDGQAPVWDVAVWLRGQSGHISAARVLYERQLQTLREKGLGLELAVGLARCAQAERAAGDLRRATTHLRAAHLLTRALGTEVAPVAAELASVLALQGMAREATELAEESRTHLNPTDRVAELAWRRATALVALCEGRHDEAVGLSDEARACADLTDWLTDRGETLEEAAAIRRTAGDNRGEREALECALALYRRKRNVVGVLRVDQALRVASA
jgi:DNA-binding SARP family transcriptional activator